MFGEAAPGMPVDRRVSGWRDVDVYVIHLQLNKC